MAHTLSTHEIARLVGSQAFSRGERYAGDGHVSEQSWTGSGMQLFGNVRGTRPKPYVVAVSFTLNAAAETAFLADFYPFLRQQIALTSHDGSFDLPETARPVLTLGISHQAGPGGQVALGVALPLPQHRHRYRHHRRREQQRGPQGDPAAPRS